ncbi:hypothetical protein [Sphingobium sp. HDIP04]|uniref:hypothetical protein n=1 Tax=Sphingobium sp. HDIP04 TaxID=428994 RepID=UPI0003877BE9|nr:hypothetical protein [Sphingobium sp. HDIP04]EQA97306.1 hypothetical protein L286_23565 [Sphingobium sp. HDIP04]
MASEEFIGRIADTAATAELASLFSAHALAIIIKRLHQDRAFTDAELRTLHTALEPLRLHADASARDMASGIYATIHAALPDKPKSG